MPSHQVLNFIYPGELNTRTGGYRYDKQLTDALRAQGQPGGPVQLAWDIQLISLAGDYPFPDQQQLGEAALQIAALDDNALVVVDGLAYSVMPEIIRTHASRLRFIALIHHPLALETGLSKAQAKTLHHLERQALHFARHVVTTSQLTADSLADYGVPAHKVTAILPGTDSAPLAQGSGSDVLNLLCVATLTPRKGHAILLDALASIKALPWHLHCVGSTQRDDYTYQSLIHTCAQHDLQHRVTFCGELDERALQQRYLMADVFVLASYHEGYGMVLAEAIAHGLPIVCSNAGAMSQTVPAGAGLLVPPGDSATLAQTLDRVLSDSPKRAELQSAARAARLQTRSWKQAADEFAVLLHKH